MWISFLDMHSGGGTKTDYEKIFIEAENEGEGVEIFEKVFDECPYDVACECCGSNFSVGAYETLEKATEYHRRGKSLEEYVQQEDVKVIYKQEQENI